jgi:hypothetical protein
LDLARFGIDLEAEIMSSVLARTVLARSIEDAEDAVYELVNCDPTDASKVMQYQMTVRRMTDMYKFLREQIEAGRHAADKLQDDEHFND